METNYDDIELFSFINLWIYQKNLKCNEKCKRKQQQTERHSTNVWFWYIRPLAKL